MKFSMFIHPLKDRRKSIGTTLTRPCIEHPPILHIWLGAFGVFMVYLFFLFRLKHKLRVFIKATVSEVLTSIQNLKKSMTNFHLKHSIQRAMKEEACRGGIILNGVCLNQATKRHTVYPGEVYLSLHSSIEFEAFLSTRCSGYDHCAQISQICFVNFVISWCTFLKVHILTEDQTILVSD